LVPIVSVPQILVGRKEEIGRLNSHFEDAVNGRGSAVLISGEAGVGKTRLVNEFLDHARSLGVRVLSGWCLSEGSISYFPFIEAFNNQAPSYNSSEKSIITEQLGIAGWLKGPGAPHTHTPSRSSYSPEVERDRTFEAVSSTLMKLSASQPTILFLDDLHWADSLSLAMLHYIARKCRGSHLMIVGTFRPEELQAQEGKVHPLQETLFSMSREDLLDRVDLSPLSKANTAELISSVLKSGVDEKLVDRVFTETEGNPLFTMETLRLLNEEGVLAEKNGRWILTSPIDDVQIPGKVLDVINRRITRLGRDERKILNAASVCGFTFDGEVLRDTLGMELTDVLQSLGEIENRHRLIRSEDTQFRFSHHKIREAIYSTIPLGLRKAYNVKAAVSLEGRLTLSSPDARVASVAQHYVDGGTPEKAFPYLLTLGEKAVNIYANVQAIDFLTKALDATTKDKSLATNENLGKILGLRGRALMGQGLAPKAVDDLRQSLEHYSALGDESHIAEISYFLGSAGSVAGDVTGSMRYLNEALTISRRIGNKNVECRCLYDLSWPLLFSTDTIDKVHAGLEESTRICEEVGDKVLQSHNEFWVGILNNFSGEFASATQHLEKAVALTEETGEIFYNLFSNFILGMAKAGRGQFDDAVKILEETKKTAEDNGIAYFAPRTLNALGWIHHDLYDFDEAVKLNKGAFELGKAQIALLPALLNLGFDYLSMGDKESSRSYFEEAKGNLTQHQCVQWRYELKSLYGLSSIAMAEGRNEEALRLVDGALDISRKAGAKKHIAKCLKLRAEVLEAMGDREVALEEMRGALSQAQLVGYPPLLWETHHALGKMLKARGEEMQAAQSYSEAIRLLEGTASSIRNPSLRNTLVLSGQMEALRKML